MNHLRSFNNINNPTKIESKGSLCMRKKQYKTESNKNFQQLYDKKLDSIDNNSKLLLFKTLKSEYKPEYYLNYPEMQIRKLISKFRISDHSLAIETGRYKNIPRNERICTTCNVLDDEHHFFYHCRINNKLRPDFFNNFQINDNNFTEVKLETVLNPSSMQQVKNLGAFIKQSIELKTGGS